MNRFPLPLATIYCTVGSYKKMPGQMNLGLAAVAFISPQNHPILVRAFSGSPDDLLKYHYLAHISLDVIDERGKPASPQQLNALESPHPQSPRRPKYP